MTDILQFYVDPLEKEQLEQIKELNELLSSIGITIKHRNSKTTGASVTIKYDTNEVKKRISRNAGRKTKYVYKETTVAEVRTRMHTEPAEQIAKDLGLSRSTLFRKLKYAEENGNDTLC